MNKIIYILMATYNGEKHISEQLDSLLNQTYCDWTLWIHDDNSKDKTVEIIKHYKTKYPDKIKFLDDNLSTGGAKENFTYLLNNIDDNFDYLMFCDQDDVWLENKIEITLNKMLDTEKKDNTVPILIHTDLKVVDEKLNIISESMFKYQKLNINNQRDIKMISIENIITGCTMMLNRQLVLVSKNIPKEAIMHDWWIAIITLKQGGRIEFVNQSTMMYRQHSLNTIGSKEIGSAYYMQRIFSIRDIYDNYVNLYKQLKKANINLSVVNFFITKTITILKKITS